MTVRRARPRKAGQRTVARTKVGTRAALAVAFLAAIAVTVVLVGRRGTKPGSPSEDGTASDMVVEAAERAGCGRERVEIEPMDESPGGGRLVTVRAPAGFKLEPFVLGVEAAAHNTGGRVESLPLGESGGYGLARLEGTLAGERVRVIVLGESVRRRVADAKGGKPAPLLAVLLDDGGNSLDVLHGIAALPTEVAVAVLSNAPHAAAVARALGADHREVLLHMPMEPLPGVVPGPGPGALEVGQRRGEVRDRLDEALTTVATARGMNNHMGSRATADRFLMRMVMEEVRARGLYFIDSRTTQDSVALDVARELGVPAAERNVFLDVVVEPEAIRRALARAVSDARAAGSAVAIGHVHPVTIETLAQELPRLAGEGVRLVRPSRLVTASR